jgi:hypothetical protein
LDFNEPAKIVNDDFGERATPSYLNDVPLPFIINNTIVQIQIKINFT